MSESGRAPKHVDACIAHSCDGRLRANDNRERFMTMEHAVLARLHSLRGVVSDEYAGAIDFALALMQSRSRRVDRCDVVQLLTTRAQSCDYIALRSVLLELAREVEQLDSASAAVAE